MHTCEDRRAMSIDEGLTHPYDEHFVGTWRIVHTDMWDRGALDLLGPAHMSFRDGGTGRMQFVAVDATIDYRSGAWGGSPCIEFTFAGEDDGEPTSGRGWARLEGGELRGKIFFHMSDETFFMATGE